VPPPGCRPIGPAQRHRRARPRLRATARGCRRRRQAVA
jgi:hypothetical protein